MLSLVALLHPKRYDQYRSAKKTAIRSDREWTRYPKSRQNRSGVFLSCVQKEGTLAARFQTKGIKLCGGGQSLQALLRLLVDDKVTRFVSSLIILSKIETAAPVAMAAK